MANILWIVNKYLGKEKEDEFFPYFLTHTQKELVKEGHQLSFCFFSDSLANNKHLNNKFVYKDDYHQLSSKEIESEASRIEKKYEFTFKQAYFADIVQTFKGQNHRKITVPEKDFSDLSFLVTRFLFLEKVILANNIDVIFSDVSPEAEMEFGRVIGYKLNKIVLKSSEGSALGKTVLLRSFKFGKDQLVEAPINNYTNDEAEVFCKDFIKNQRVPYSRPKRNIVSKTLSSRINDRIKKKDFLYFLIWPFKIIKGSLLSLYYLIERRVFKPILYDTYNPNVPYLFIGFHLNQESTMVLRAQPYTNQTILVEMLSRVLPHNHTLYVRAHPHWPDRYTFKYLSTLKKFPGVKLISERISIHEIIKNSKAILTYNATTGIEALIYNKPVLSFASNIYKEHPAVSYCSDLFDLGEKLSKLVNTTVDNNDTISFITKINSCSIDFLLGSSFFISEMDSIQKAEVFSDFLHEAIVWCSDNKN